MKLFTVEDDAGQRVQVDAASALEAAGWAARRWPDALMLLVSEHGDTPRPRQVVVQASTIRDGE